MKAIKLTRDYFESIAIIVLVLIIMLVYTTADLDTTPPNIENITHSEITESSAIISWTTNEPSNSFIEYGTSTGNYEYNYQNNDYIDIHSFLIQELLPETTYYYRVSSTDVNGNTNTSEEQQFTTLEDITSPVYTTITQTPESNQTYNETQTYRFEVDWKDNAGISEVTITHNFYGNQTTEQATFSNNTYVFEITGLKPGIYSWHMNASDMSGNTESTITQIYSIRKAEPIITLTINGQSNSYSAYINETLNITASSLIPFNGLVEVLVDGAVLPPSGSVVSFLKNFELAGTHEVIVRFNETENFTSTNKTLNIAVTSPQLILNPSKQSYAISELAAFTFSFPQGSIIEWEICGPIPIGAGFVECSNPQTLSGITSPYAITHIYTNKTGNYSIKVQASHNSMLLESIKYYSVINTINHNIEGSTDVLVGEEINIKSTASGGIPPYSYQWRLSNDSIINGQELKTKYNFKGNYPVNLTIIDSKGNTISSNINIVVSQKYLLKITIQDSETKSKIQDAGVRVDSQEKFTDSSGLVEFELKEDDYSIRIDASGYKRYNSNIDIDSNKSFTYELNKSSSLFSEFNIQLTNPYDGYVHGGYEVRLEANINSDNSAECSLYVADGNEWSKQIRTFTAQGNYNFEHLIKVEEKKKYTWNIECIYQGKTYASAKRVFTTRGYAELSATFSSSEVVDAGELRRQLSNALDNIASLDLREKQVAEALQLNEILEKALRDYDRIIRDINNLQFRRDLSEYDLDKKRIEYRNDLKKMELETPINLEVIELEEFVVYPKKDELKVIALHYADSTQHTGNLNLESLSELQNSVLVKTKVATVTLSLISSQSKDITLIHKEISYPKGVQEKDFLLESIPKEFSERADKIEYLQDYTVINNDPLIKFNNPEKITYYVEGHKNLEVAKQATTIMFSEGVFAKKGNQLTGNVILTNIEVTSPVFIIALLVIIIFAYIIYAYDLHNRIISLVSPKSRRKNLEKMLSLIYDAKELLKTNEVESANLIFREIRLIYERLKFDFKKESYEEALILYDQINLKYFEKKLAELQAKESSGVLDFQELKKLIKLFDFLEERQKQALTNELILTYNSFIERNIRGKNW